MNADLTTAQPARKPSLEELGRDLLEVGPIERAWSLVLPFALCAGFFITAAHGWWIAAVLCVMAQSFFTYGSVSHDLVHRTLRLPEWLNEALLFLLELINLRSGHAYRSSHLHHHARFPADDDMEGRAAGMGVVRALWEGVVTQPRLWLWALRRASGSVRFWILGEGLLVLALLTTAALLWPATKLPAIYCALIVAGSWVFPLVTVVFPHDRHGASPLTQTRLFRGHLFRWLAFEHLYHLEHHLYPQVPHHRWPELARRLDPYFTAAGVTPIVLWK